MEGQTSVEEEGEENLNVESESLTLQQFNHSEDSGYRGLYLLSYIKNNNNLALL